MIADSDHPACAAAVLCFCLGGSDGSDSGDEDGEGGEGEEEDGSGSLDGAEFEGAEFDDSDDDGEGGEEEEEGEDGLGSEGEGEEGEGEMEEGSDGDELGEFDEGEEEEGEEESEDEDDLTEAERRALALDRFKRKQVEAAAKEAGAQQMETNIGETERFTLPSGQEVEAEKATPPDLAVVQRR